MIKLDDKYFIKADDNEFALCEKTIIKSGKMKGTEILKSIGYYSTMQSVLEGYYKLKTRLYVAENDCSLKDAIKEFERIKNEIKNLVDI